MQIGIDLGATKVEYVLLDNDNKEIKRDRIETPENYNKTISLILDIIEKVQNDKEKFNIGICHPGTIDKTTGLIKNAHNSQWLNGKNLIKDLKKKLVIIYILIMMLIVFVCQSLLMVLHVIMKQYLVLY